MSLSFLEHMSFLGDTNGSFSDASNSNILYSASSAIASRAHEPREGELSSHEPPPQGNPMLVPPSMAPIESGALWRWYQSQDMAVPPQQPPPPRADELDPQYFQFARVDSRQQPAAADHAGMVHALPPQQQYAQGLGALPVSSRPPVDPLWDHRTSGSLLYLAASTLPLTVPVSQNYGFPSVLGSYSTVSDPTTPSASAAAGSGSQYRQNSGWPAYMPQQPPPPPLAASSDRSMLAPGTLPDPGDQLLRDPHQGAYLAPVLLFQNAYDASLDALLPPAASRGGFPHMLSLGSVDGLMDHGQPVYPRARTVSSESHFQPAGTPLLFYSGQVLGYPGLRGMPGPGEQGMLVLVHPKLSHLHSKPKLQLRRIARQSRSRSGCWVCRIRHLKCDEKKPTCGGCGRLSLMCDYSPDRPYYMVDKDARLAKLEEIATIWKGRLAGRKKSNPQE